MKTYKGLIKSLEPNQIIVFGSNPSGIHGGGVARIAAERYGAVQGVGRGLMGQAYGLVTKNLTPHYFEKSTKITYHDAGMRSVPKEAIIENISELYSTAFKHPDKEFLVAYTANGQNLNGYTDDEMAEMFVKGIRGNNGMFPENIVFEEGFAELFKKHNNIFEV